MQDSLVRPLFSLCQDPAGTLIFKQGEVAEYLYVVVDGEVNIRFKPDDGPELIVARVRPEGVVGWSAALGSPNYTSSAICATDCQMLRISGQDLRELCIQYPDIGSLLLERLAIVIAERLRNTHHHVINLLRQGLRVNVNRPIMAEYES
jgi:CRP-like cAMP-binding protein